MNTTAGEMYSINSLSYSDEKPKEYSKEDFGTPIKHLYHNADFYHYMIPLDDNSDYSENSSEKYLNDQNLPKCLLNTLLLRLDQSSPVTNDIQSPNNPKPIDCFISSFSKKLDFNDIEIDSFPSQSNSNKESTKEVKEFLFSYSNQKKRKNKSNSNQNNKFNTIISSIPKKKKDKKKKKKAKPFQGRQCDWRCEHCNNINFGFRILCNRCHHAKGYVKAINQ